LHPAVGNCVVRTYAHAEHDVRLAAYVVPRTVIGEDGAAGRTALGRQIRAFLETRLPSYMVPSAVMVIDAIPLTINGKVDAAALPAPRVSSLASTCEPTRPATPLEQRLSAMFAQVLGADRVDLHDDFFELGGHSLAAMHLASRIAESLGVRVSMRLVLEGRTVEALAQRLDALTRASSQPAGNEPARLPPITRAAASSSYPVSIAQEATLAPRNLSSDRRLHVCGAFEIRQPVDAARLERACRELIDRHEVLRTSFDLERLLQRVSRDVPFALPVYDCSVEQALARHYTFVEPFDLTKAPLFRAELLRLPDGRSHLLLDLHHAVADAVSLALMMSELWTLCAGGSLDPVPLQYKDYAVWQDQLAKDGAFARDEAFWHAAVENLTWTALPPRPGDRSSRVGQAVLSMEAPLRAKIQAAAARGQLTEMAILLAAINATMSARTGQHDIALGLIVSRRSDATLERMLGMFVEDMAYRVTLPDVNDLSDVTRRTADALIAALEHPMYSYERLNLASQQQRPTPNGELFTLLVNWMPPMAVPSAPVRFMTLPRHAGTRYDISLRLRDEGCLTLDAKYRSDKYSDECMHGFIRDVLRTADRIAGHVGA
jgi:acyl carrier protein